MKAHHSRNLSASAAFMHKTGSFSNNSSPSNSAYPKKDRHDFLQASDLKLNLQLNLNMGSKTTKASDSKNGRPVTGLKTLKQSSIADKNPNTLSKKNLSVINKNSCDSAERGVIEKSERRVSKNLDHQEHNNNNHEKNFNKANRPSSYHQKSKGASLAGSKVLGLSDLMQPEYLTKLNKNTNSTENKKGTLSPRGSMPHSATSKQQVQMQAQQQQHPGHTKNKKSFDFASLYPNKKLYFSDSYSKQQPTTNYSTNETEIYNKSKMNQNEMSQQQQQQQQYFNAGSGQMMAKSIAIEKVTIATGAKLNNYMGPKHNRVPSFDGSNKNSYQKLIGQDLEKSRRSSDIAVDLRLSGLNSSDYSSKKLPFKLRYAIRTRAGSNHTGARKTNQDSYIAQSNFGRSPDKFLFGVCDGHGTNGHLVSSFLKETLPRYLLADPQIEVRPEVTFTNMFELCHQKLLFCDFDTRFSGSTCINLLISGDKLISANAGDSRAIMATYNHKWDCVPLSNDHKPDLLYEAQRILMSGGRIDSFKDAEGNSLGPNRVWLRDQDVPGLAMSRSIGDVVASTVGVTCRPEVLEFNIVEDSKFIIVASDGVWEFIENMEAVKMVAPFYAVNDLEGACDFLLEAALKRWQEEEENVVDDITLIIIFL